MSHLEPRTLGLRSAGCLSENVCVQSVKKYALSSGIYHFCSSVRELVITFVGFSYIESLVEQSIPENLKTMSCVGCSCGCTIHPRLLEGLGSVISNHVASSFSS